MLQENLDFPERGKEQVVTESELPFVATKSEQNGENSIGTQRKINRAKWYRMPSISSNDVEIDKDQELAKYGSEVQASRRTRFLFESSNL